MSKAVIATLRGEIRELERTLSGPTRKASREPRRRVSARDKVMAEIRDMEERLGCTYMEDDVEEEAFPLMGVDELEMAPACGDPMTASETESGVEDEITQDYLSDVEDEEHGTELATDPTTLAVGEKVGDGSKPMLARWKRASARLDRVSDYLEKHGQERLALRIDQIADRVDAAIKEEEGE